MERKNDNKSCVENYGLVDNTHNRSMKKRILRIDNQTEDNNGGTLQLPIDGEGSLFSGLTEPFHLIRKFRKGEPEAYLTVDSLLKDEDFLASRRVFVRENHFGFVPVLLALGNPNCRFTVSSWMVDRKDVMEKNAESNLVENRVYFATEGLNSQDESYDTAVLIHEQHQNPDILVYEATRILSPDSCNTLFFATHKKKGGVSVSERIAQELGLEVSWSKKGMGGAIVVKFSKKQPIPKPEIPVSSFVYKPQQNVQLKFEAAPSLFSTKNVDIGTDFLIKNVLAEINPDKETSIYDIACGYGAIGLSLASCLRNAHIIMSDADARAVDMAQRNIDSTGLGNNVSVQLSDGAKEIEGAFDFVVSNPPLHTDRPKLIEILTRANRLVKKGGRMLLVVEDSRVEELKEILEPYVGFIKEKAKIPTHSILELRK